MGGKGREAVRERERESISTCSAQTDYLCMIDCTEGKTVSPAIS